MFWRDEVSIIDAQKNIPGLDASGRGRATCMYILKNPTFSILREVFQVGCAYGSICRKVALFQA
jgi:hypothetical protein